MRNLQSKGRTYISQIFQIPPGEGVFKYFWTLGGYFKTFDYNSLGFPPAQEQSPARIVMFLVGDPYKPSFATVTGRGDSSK